MPIKIIISIVTCISLAGCFLTPPSRSYTELKPNVKLVNAGAFNIDHIKPVKIEVESTKAWQNTAVFVESGDVISIQASGSWSPAPAMLAWSGPEGNSIWAVEVNGVTGGALMARLGHDGRPFEIGLSQTFKAMDYGMLYLAMNDPFRYLYDNEGKVIAEVYSPGSNSEKNPSQQNMLHILSYQYDEKSGNGSLAAKVGKDALGARQRLINKIGEIASSKNIAIKAGNEPLQGGTYELLGETSQNGVLEIKFRTLW